MVKRQILATVIIFSSLGLPAHADQAKDAFKRGLKAERQSDFETAYTQYKQAYTLSPRDARYLSAYTRIKFNAGAKHVHDGQFLRNTGAMAEAIKEFQRAVEIDASNFAAQQELRRTTDMMRRQEKAKAAPKPAPAASPAEDIADVLSLQPISNGVISLRLTVNADQAYKTIGKLAGLNVLIDPDYRPQKITVDLTDVTLHEALDMVRLQSKTFWRPVLGNTIFVAADSPAKRKELEQNVMKTFYLQNVSTPAELQEAGTLVKQMLDVNRVQLLPSQDALILRGTPDQMILAEKLLADFDKPKSEVVIDVAVMQVSRDRLRTLGTNVPTSVGIGVLPGGSGGGSNGESHGGGVGGWTVGNFTFSVSGGSFTFLASDSNTKLLQNPEIRALNDQKATLRIGDRVPIATGSFQPGMVGGGGVSPLVSTQFQYLDVGVNIDITPHIHTNNEVTLKLGLEISSVTGSESIGGITQPIIGQRRIDHETRLQDGEVNLLGGILEDSETQSMSGYPWVSKIPILKYLFAQDNRERRENEIVFAITPHIIRAKDVTEDNRRVIEVGTGNSIELRKKANAPAKQAVPSSPPGAAASPASAPGTQPPVSPQEKSGASR